MKFIASSEGLGQNWFYYAPDRLLFDCGEGVGEVLKHKVFAIDAVLLTHGHMDHVAGLFRLVCMRGSIRGDKTKPLTIYYPENEPQIDAYRNFLSPERLRLPYQLKWMPISIVDEMPLKQGRYLKVFPTTHADYFTCGYTACEQVRSSNLNSHCFQKLN